MTISVKNRRDPLGRKNGISTRNGFTLIELMVVVAVVAIITSLALPSYRTLIEKRQVTSGAEQLGAFMSAVQIEAVKRSENISVSYARTDASTWCIGIISGTTACDCTITNPVTPGACVIDSQLRLINGSNLNFPGIMNAMNGDGAFVYDPARGLMVDHADAAELELLSENGTFELNVQVSATGRVRTCSDDSSHKVPGYDEC